MWQTWKAHFEAAGMAVELTLAAFEQAIVDRLFFDPRRLLVASKEARLVGFAHWMVLPEQTERAVIAAVCVRPGEDAAAVGEQLIAACEAAASAAGCSVILGGNDPRFLTGYAGLSPLGPGEGIADADRVATAWFMQHAYSPAHRIGRYSLALAQFRPPLDRSQMQLRRTAAVSHETMLPTDPRTAAALAHADLERFTAQSRGGQRLAWATFHLSTPEAQVFPTSQAILADWGCDVEDDPQAAATRFTIGGALQQLQQLGVRRVEAVASDGQPDRAVMLRSLRFNLDGEGTVFSKRL